MSNQRRCDLGWVLFESFVKWDSQVDICQLIHSWAPLPLEITASDLPKRFPSFRVKVQILSISLSQ